MRRILLVLVLLSLSRIAAAQQTPTGSTTTAQLGPRDNHALQVGAGVMANAYWSPVPGVRGDLTWLRRYDPSHGFFLRLEGGGSLAEAGASLGSANTEARKRERAYTATLVLGVREWLGARKRGFVEVGIRAGAIVVTDAADDSLDVYLAKELLTVAAGVALGRHHDVDLLFTTGWGFPSGGGVFLRVPLWHQTR